MLGQKGTFYVSTKVTVASPESCSTQRGWVGLPEDLHCVWVLLSQRGLLLKETQMSGCRGLFLWTVIIIICPCAWVFVRLSGQMFSAGELASERFAFTAELFSACYSTLHNGSRYLWRRIRMLRTWTLLYWITSQMISLQAHKLMWALLSQDPLSSWPKD